ncbi:competence/damage-inducible protein cinA [Halobacillus karajensis]|uniref:competence/damage-inducible protein A n=1 Tax=Halobacillus karajensis TaxID=195088 RepID=UPI0008A75876|nr:competence/damage-inducible protein A [Halobacillus karajensis]SEH74058.1 competence/damage-inducible protein cinA [Halobacillus karajensis]
MRSEIIAVGTELLLGQISNTNAQWISSRLADLGIPVYHHTVVGDNLERVSATFNQAQERSDVVIVTGGLGPTEDDLTREGGKVVFGQELVEHKETMEKIQRYFDQNQKRMSENNRKQALVFKDADVLENSEGMAPGQIYHHNRVLWVFLPGVPTEMKHLVNNHVIPYIRSKFQLGSQIVSEMMHFIGIGESDLETKLHSFITSQTNPTIAPLASEGEVGLRLTATGDTTDEARQKIKDLKHQLLEYVGDFYYGSDSITIEETVSDLLKEKELTIGSAESFTGGKFLERMVSLPGASSICKGGCMVYTAEMKENILHVPKSLINEYGTISYECAEVMALKSKELLNVDIAVSFTGVAGPSSSEGQPPGTVFIGLQIGEKKTEVYKYHFHGGRDQVRIRAVKKAYEILFHRLKK